MTYVIEEDHVLCDSMSYVHLAERVDLTKRGKNVELDSARRRRALARALDMAQMTPAEASRQAGFTTPNAIYNFLNGRSGSLSADTIERLAKVIPGATVTILTGTSGSAQNEIETLRVLVRLEVRAGVFRDTVELPIAQQFSAAVPIPGDQFARGAFGAIVAGPGMDLVYQSGTILVVIPMTAEDAHIRDGRRVLLKRSKGRATELSVRELKVSGRSAWLWPRSSDPAHQTPIEAPWPLPHKPWTLTTGETGQIIGVVTMSCIPEDGDLRNGREKAPRA